MPCTNTLPTRFYNWEGTPIQKPSRISIIIKEAQNQPRHNKRSRITEFYKVLYTSIYAPLFYISFGTNLERKEANVIITILWAGLDIIQKEYSMVYSHLC